MKPPVRWLVYAALLAGTLFAAVSVHDADEAAVAAPAVVGAVDAGQRADRKSTPASVPASEIGIDMTRLERAAHGRPTGDPFGARAWESQALAAQQRALAAATPVVAPAPPPPQAPPLPFTFLGRLVDAGRAAVFLSAGDRVLTARIGDTLQGRYRVEAIDDTGIDLVYLPLDARQRLVFAAGAVATRPLPRTASRTAGSPPGAQGGAGQDEDDD